MTFYVENETSIHFDFSIEEVAKDVAEAVLDMENCPYETEIELTIVDEDTIKQYNAKFREIDQITDVLSFPGIEFEKEADFEQIDEKQADYFDPDTGELVLGNMMICAKRMLEQAENYGHSVKREFAFLVAHSLLHLCGYDHMQKEEAEIMERKQEAVLNKLGIRRE